jgi:HD domain protein
MYTFHTAEHSRFSHSLGVYEIARRICDNFARNYATQEEGDGLWDDRNRLVVLCAALLHDVGHGPYSHTFEKIFDTNHEQITIDIILSEGTEVNQILRKVSSTFPQEVASVIQKTHPNPQVVQLISSQIDADRMDYLLRDAYFTGVNYGTFDLTRILRVIRPYKGGIAFTYSGMHAVEDYIVSRYQMYMQVYFHPVSRGMEVVLNHLLKRASACYNSESNPLKHSATFLKPFFEGTWTLEDYLRLDDGVLNTYFSHWLLEEDAILSDLSDRFINRRPFKSVPFNRKNDGPQVERMKQIVEAVGFDPEYYTAINNSFDLPYDFYRPDSIKPRTQIELVERNGNMVELSQVSSIVEAISGKVRGDERLYFPREMVTRDMQNELFMDDYEEFQTIAAQLDVFSNQMK